MTSARSNVVNLRELTDDQIAERFARSHAEQERFFHRFGLVVIPTRGKIEGLPRGVQMLVEAWAKGRFRSIAR